MSGARGGEDARSRLLRDVAARVLPLIGGAPTLVAVDGVDGAGKTVFADELATTLRREDVEVVRVLVDGFHQPKAVRYRRGRDSPEGFFLDSYDLRALEAQVLDPLQAGGDRRIVRAIHDVEADRALALPAEPVGPDTVVLLDGIFLHRDELRDRWDLSIYLDVPFEVSVPRGNARFGVDPDPAATVNRRYVEGQRLYLDRCDPKRRATLVVDNTDLAAPRLIAEH